MHRAPATPANTPLRDMPNSPVDNEPLNVDAEARVPAQNSAESEALLSVKNCYDVAKVSLTGRQITPGVGLRSPEDHPR